MNINNTCCTTQRLDTVLSLACCSRNQCWLLAPVRRRLLVAMRLLCILQQHALLKQLDLAPGGGDGLVGQTLLAGTLSDAGMGRSQ